MKIKISLIAAGLFAGSALFADSANITDALKNGKINGEFFIYAEQSDIKGADDEGFGSGSFDLGFTTDSLYGFTFDVGSRANHAFWEIDGSEYTQSAKAILHTVNIAYSHPHLDVILGRQKIELEWMEDYHEALVLVGKGIPYTRVLVGYAQRIATADGDQPLSGFNKIGKDGVFVADVKYEGIQDLVLNPYFYYANNYALWGGAKAAYDGDFGEFKIGGTLQYVQSAEDNDSKKDGSFLQVEARGTFADVNAFLGFLKTGKKGIGAITDLGDIYLFEDGYQIYEKYAKTFYLGANYKWNKFEFGGIFGNTEYNDGKMREFDLTIAYGLTNNLKLSGAFVNGNGEGDDDYNKVSLAAVYSF